MGLQDRIVPLDDKAAEMAAMIAANRKRAGNPSELRDTLIAGIAVSRRAEFATRNSRRFADLDIRIIDP
jgi:predicted nucleic acid-binding protein